MISSSAIAVVSLLLIGIIAFASTTAPTAEANGDENENADNLKRIRRQGCWPFGGACPNPGSAPFGGGLYNSKLLSKQRSWQRSQEKRYREMLSKQRSLEKSLESHYNSFQRSQERSFRRQLG